MTESNYTTEVDVEQVYDLMAQHARVSMQANELAFERMFEVEEMDTQAQLEATTKELELVSQANSLAFRIASSFMTPQFIGGFQEHWNNQPAES